MTEEQPYISPPPEADGNYRYFCFAGDIPVRVTYDERGRQCGAEAPVYELNGRLGLAHRLMSAMKKGDYDVSQITKAEFVEMCRDYMGTRKGKPTSLK